MKKRLGIVVACLLISVCALGLAACNPNDDGETTLIPNETVYTVTFVADGKTVGTDTYTAEDKTITEPEVPFKAGYLGAWESYALTEGDVTVNAVYTPIEYTVTFVADGETVGTATYTAEDKTITEPEVPFKAGYLGVWESYTLTEGDLTVNAVYTAMSPEEAIIGTFYQYIGGKQNQQNYFVFEEKGVLTAYTDTESVNGSYIIDENSNITFTYEVSGQTFEGEGTLNYGVIVLNLDGQFEILCQEGAAPFADANGAKFGIYNGSAILLSYDGEDAAFTVPDSVTIDSAQYDVTAVANYAFQGCGLSSITIGGNVTSIGNWAFKDCNGLTSITIGESVTSVGWSRDEGSGLTVYAETAEKPIGWHDRWIGYDCPVVWDCKNNDVATDGNIYYVDENGIRYAIKNGEASVARQAISTAEANLSSTIHYKGSSYNVTSIGKQAFIFCSKLTSVEIPNGITVIGEAAFRNCGNLKSISIPDSVKSIGREAFYECTALTDINIPNGVTSIESSAFNWCSSLTNIAIPESVTDLDNDAFEGCDSLSYISVEESNPSYCSKDGILYDKAKTRIIHVPTRISGAVAIPSGVTVIPSAAFSGCSGLISIVIPDGVTSIGEEAFSGCSGLTSITIPDSVTYIGRESFSECHFEEAVFIHYTGWEDDWRTIESETLQDPRLAAAYLLEHNDGAWQNDGTYRVTFVADGRTVAIKDYKSEEAYITEPDVPAKNGYTGAWEDYALVGYVTVNAVYTPIEYKVTFVANGVTVDTVTYTVENKEITEPTVPEKSNYIGTWESYTLTTGDISVNAVYTPAVYTVTFVADGETVGTDTYTVEDKTVTEPKVPERETPGYAGQWESYSLTSGNITIHAEYTPIEYTVTFVAGEEVVSCAKYTVENRNVTEPKVPERTNETGEWESYTLTFGDLTVRVLYTSKGATSGLVYALSEDKASYSVTGYTGDEIDIMLPALYRSLPVTGIADNAFAHNSTLEKVYLPEGQSDFNSIGDGAFFRCTALKDVIMSACLVQTIGASAFEGCSAMKVIGLPYVLKEIGNAAFCNCSSLINFSIPDSVLSIGNVAFYNCIELTGVKIGNGVTAIGERVFDNCRGLTSITIPNSVTSIGDWAFYGCSGLTSVEIGNGVTYIGKSAFSGSGLTQIKIPKSVSIIESDAFICEALTVYSEAVSEPIGWSKNWNGNCPVVWDCNNNNLATDDNIYFVDENGIRYALSNGVATVVKQSINLVEVLIPDTIIYEQEKYPVNNIISGAFSGCSSIKAMDLPFVGGAQNNLQDRDRMFGYIFGENYFEGAYVAKQTFSPGATHSSVKNYIPNTLTRVSIRSGWISVGAFENCKNIEVFEFGKDVVSIDSRAFINCTGVEYLSIDTSNECLKSVNNCIVVGNYLVSAFKNFTIPENVLSIGEYAFAGREWLENITIPDSVASIGKNVFEGCRGLTSVTIGNGVTSIGEYAFSGCSSLTCITIPDSVTSIGDWAFFNCSGLTSITIPNSVTSIGNRAFYQCSSLTSITIPDSVTSIGKYAFSGCSGLTSITIPNSVTSIGSSAFSYCRGLTSITIPDSVTSIGDEAFAYCSGLTSITIPNSVTSIEHWAFFNCSGLTSITIPNSVTSIGSSAFSWCNGLTSITIPDSVTSIGSSAFFVCNGLTDITIPDSVTSIGSYAFSECRVLIIKAEAETKPADWESEWNGDCPVIWNSNSNDVAENGNIYYVDGNGIRFALKDNIAIVIQQAYSVTEAFIVETITYKGKTYYVTDIVDYAFFNCSGLTSITIPDSVSTIGSYAFYYCSGLTSITIPDSVTSIGDRAFFNCSGLTSITIPNSVTSIGNEAFYGCRGLTSITIPNSVTSIGDWAFSECSGLTSITIPNSVTSIGDWAFSECSGLTSITIPNSVTSIGGEAFASCSSLTSITIPDSVTSIGDEAFYGCRGLTNINFTGTTEQWHAIIKGSAWNVNTGAYTITCTDGTIEQWYAITKGYDWNYSTGNYTITCTDGTLSK